MSRKCSLAIESPIESTSTNHPLNAFLVYSNVSPLASPQAEAETMVTANTNTTSTNAAMRSASISPTADTSQQQQQQSQQQQQQQQISPQASVESLKPPKDAAAITSLSTNGDGNQYYTHRAQSVPNIMYDEGGCTSRVTRFGNRRVSICDLNNFSDEICHVKQSKYLNLSTSDLQDKDTFHRTNSVSGFIYQARSANSDTHGPLGLDDRLRCFQFRNHRRRNSIALRFDTPKVL